MNNVILIYNDKELKKEFKIETIKRLSEYFVFILYYCGRYLFGVRYLYYGKKKINQEYIFCSEIKGLYHSCILETIKIFPTGNYYSFLDNNILTNNKNETFI